MFLNKVFARYNLEDLNDFAWAKSTFEVFRGIKDIYPTQVDHRYNGDGIFGPGTYYGLTENTAEKYATGTIGLDGFRAFGLIYSYKVTPKNPLVLTPEFATGLTQHRQLIEIDDEVAEELGLMSSFPRDRLGWAALDSDYDCVILTSDEDEIDGEEQLLIPKGSQLKPKVFAVDILLNDEDDKLAEEIAKAFGGDVSWENGFLPKVINIELKPRELTKLLKKASSSID